MKLINELRKRQIIKEIGEEEYNRIIDEIYTELQMICRSNKGEDVEFVERLDSYINEGESSKNWTKFFVGATAICSSIGIAGILDEVLQTVPTMDDGNRGTAYIVAALCTVLSAGAAFKSNKERLDFKNKIKNEILSRIDKNYDNAEETCSKESDKVSCIAGTEMPRKLAGQCISAVCAEIGL